MAAPHLPNHAYSDYNRVLMQQLSGVLGRFTKPEAVSEEERARVAPILESFIRGCDNILIISRAGAPDAVDHDQITQTELLRRLAFLVLATWYPERSAAWSEAAQAQERGELPILLADPIEVRTAARQALSEHAATYTYLADH